MQTRQGLGPEGVERRQDSHITTLLRRQTDTSLPYWGDRQTQHYPTVETDTSLPYSGDRQTHHYPTEETDRKGAGQDPQAKRQTDLPHGVVISTISVQFLLHQLGKLSITVVVTVTHTPQTHFGVNSLLTSLFSTELLSVWKDFRLAY